MSKFPVVTSQKLVQILIRLGYRQDHASSGHIVLRHELPPYRRITVPDQPEIAKGVLTAVGFGPEDFIALA
ncbi:MAG: type II toxin-antitoxin system HicA family toxin [Candidatus Omnitrophota bacterium]